MSKKEFIGVLIRNIRHKSKALFFYKKKKIKDGDEIDWVTSKVKKKKKGRVVRIKEFSDLGFINFLT